MVLLPTMQPDCHALFYHGPAANRNTRVRLSELLRVDRTGDTPLDRGQPRFQFFVFRCARHQSLKIFKCKLKRLQGFWMVSSSAQRYAVFDLSPRQNIPGREIIWRHINKKTKQT